MLIYLLLLMWRHVKKKAARIEFHDKYVLIEAVNQSFDQGYARLPGAGYTAIHPELKNTKPENYPDIYRLSILADVAPYSREYNIYRQAVAKQAAHNTQLRIEYEKILERVKETKESAIKTRAPFRFCLFATFVIRYDSWQPETICDASQASCIRVK